MKNLYFIPQFMKLKVNKEEFHPVDPTELAYCRRNQGVKTGAYRCSYLCRIQTGSRQELTISYLAKKLSVE